MAAPKTTAAKPETPADETKIETTPAPGAPGAEVVDDSNMITVSTTGDFMLLDPHSGDVVPAFSSASVRRTSFINEKIADGVLVEE